ncbi:MAG TPA: hypothetical protein VGM46_12890, partial [Mesorhizobium sp.]
MAASRPRKKKSPWLDALRRRLRGVVTTINIVEDRMTRERILAGGVAAAILVAAAAFVVAPGSDANAQQKRPAPLDLGPNAASTPWTRYPGWPARDMSKFNTLA